ncbi:SAGA-associated factor 29 isoform X1 [Tachyglossus aculeatus]|uniref:SAGA-associated factor 29 isoform X1 n=1 Tax=Tachyglossus aculeatus TaxID=9261 RepID=UPI0018F4A9D9|nr:SAGA-associated factor 29 isoform X1 [Tachyglossus aculeatus]XP_038618981.1 SAGA-associated factor 29 isoform X1 [Tachyglossus aculeatus]XP_038618982.1 SAGA-associated factor 29 isoform X1 [Tachyglossus aculeatus]XP_038618983.1 SAGA-associated factor 29 isoform X1 [Tachyglossus aculeatus]XP_038618984.1 SAGA-associated factor 29 isoform X1 [Tachyglossus aculeatus]
MALVSADSRIAELLTELHQLIKQTQEERSRSEHNLVNIQKTHERMQTENKISPYYRTKLRGLYTTAKADAEAECNILRKALDKIAEIKSLLEERRIAAKIAGLYNDSEPPRKTMRRGVLMTLLQQSAMTLPLWIGKPGDKPPPLCGAIPASGDYVAKPGDKVAARVKAVDGDEQWILAEVVTYSHATNKYEVDDIDEEGKDGRPTPRQTRRPSSRRTSWCWHSTRRRPASTGPSSTPLRSGLKMTTQSCSKTPPIPTATPLLSTWPRGTWWPARSPRRSDGKRGTTPPLPLLAWRLPFAGEECCVFTCSNKPPFPPSFSSALRPDPASPPPGGIFTQLPP